MTYNEWYTNNITPSELDKIKKSREEWIKNAESYSKKAAYADFRIKKLEKLLDKMAYTLDLLVDDSSNNRNWFKVKEVLDEYEQYRRDSKMVDNPNKPSSERKQGSSRKTPRSK